MIAAMLALFAVAPATAPHPPAPLSLQEEGGTARTRQVASLRETDEFAYTAGCALAGRYGTLQPWQRHWYMVGLRAAPRQAGWAYLTSYGPWDPPQVYGGGTAAQNDPDDGGRIELTEAHCAADRGLPFGTVVWSEGSLRIVRDRGGAVTVGRARGHCRRNDRNLDFWTPRPDEYSGSSVAYWVIGREGQ